MKTLDESLKQIVYDDRHSEWLLSLAQSMRETAEVAENGASFTGRELNVPMDCLMADTEEHTIWLLLCGKFGDWTICVNYAWIDRENLIPCAEYIESLCR